MKNRHYLWPVFLFLVWPIGLSCKPQVKLESGESHEFANLRAAVCDGKFSEALPKLVEYVERNGDAKDARRAGLFLFKCCVALKKFDQAKEWCEWTITKFPESLEADKCRYKLAFLLLVDGKADEARLAFGNLKNKTSPLAAESVAMHDFLNRYDFKPRTK